MDRNVIAKQIQLHQNEVTGLNNVVSEIGIQLKKLKGFRGDKSTVIEQQRERDLDKIEDAMKIVKGVFELDLKISGGKLLELEAELSKIKDK